MLQPYNAIVSVIKSEYKITINTPSIEQIKQPLIDEFKQYNDIRLTALISPFDSSIEEINIYYTKYYDTFDVLNKVRQILSSNGLNKVKYKCNYISANTLDELKEKVERV